MLPLNISPTSWLIVALVLAIPITYGATSVYWQRVLAGTVRAEIAAADKRCELRIEEISVEHKKEVARRVDEARRAASEIEPTPTDKKGLAEICARSASCIDRGKFKQ